MKKWLITGLVVLALVAAGVSVHWWLRLLPFFRTNSDLIQGLSGAIQIVLWLGAGLAFVFGPWRSRRKAQDPSGRVKLAQSTQTGGVNVIGEASIGGDAVGRDKVTIIHQAPVPVSAPSALHQLPTPPDDFTGRAEELADLVAVSPITPSVFNPILTYGGITSSGGFFCPGGFDGRRYNFTLINIKNTQLNVATTAHGVTATMKFCHASGDRFLVRNVKWLEREPQLHLASSVAIPMNDVKLLIFSGATEENINYFFPDAGKWNVEIIIKADNCGALVIKGGLLVLSDTQFKFDPPFQAANLDT